LRRGGPINPAISRSRRDAKQKSLQEPIAKVDNDLVGRIDLGRWSKEDRTVRVWEKRFKVQSMERVKGEAARKQSYYKSGFLWEQGRER